MFFILDAAAREIKERNVTRLAMVAEFHRQPAHGPVPIPPEATRLVQRPASDGHGLAASKAG